MRRRRPPIARTPTKPADAEAGAALIRKFAIKLFDRAEGEAANWPLIADTLFKAAFDALDRSPDDARRAALLRLVHAVSYERLTAAPATDTAQAAIPENEAAQAGDLKPSEQDSLNAFRNTF
jgi:hypothetical protein